MMTWDYKGPNFGLQYKITYFYTFCYTAVVYVWLEMVISLCTVLITCYWFASWKRYLKCTTKPQIMIHFVHLLSTSNVCKNVYFSLRNERDNFVNRLECLGGILLICRMGINILATTTFNKSISWLHILQCQKEK